MERSRTQNEIFVMFRRNDYLYIYDGPEPRVWTDVRNTSYSINLSTMVTGTALEIRASFDGTTWTIFVNDVLERTVSQSTFRNSPASAVRIGAQNTTNSNGPTDTVNHVTLLSDSFYQRRYASPLPTANPGSEEAVVDH